MKPTVLAIAAIFILTAAFAANAQTTTPPVAAPQAIPVKLAVIDTDAFGDPKTGVKKLLAVFTQIDGLLKTLRDEITAKQTRYNALVTEIQNAQKTNAQISQAKIDEAQQLESEIKRKQEDGQKALERYNKQMAAPVNIEISNAVQAFARQKGYDIVIDAAKFAGTMIVLNKAVDITDAFIADFNAKNPAATTPAASVKP